MSVEAGYTPNGEQFAENNAQEQSGVNPFDAFVERLAPTGERAQSEESGLQLVHPFDSFAFMDKVTQKYLGFEGNEIGFKPTEEQYQLVNHVKLAYGIIAHPLIEEWQYRNEIEQQVAMDRALEGNNRVVLTDEERKILVKIARAAGMPCDPERTEYFYDEIPQITLPQEELIGMPKVVDAAKS